MSKYLHVTEFGDFFFTTYRPTVEEQQAVVDGVVDIIDVENNTGLNMSGGVMSWEALPVFNDPE